MLLLEELWVDLEQMHAVSIIRERIYLAGETGWGVNTKTKKVIGRKGAKHIYNRKTSDESHKTLMLGICGNGEVGKKCGEAL